MCGKPARADDRCCRRRSACPSQWDPAKGEYEDWHASGRVVVCRPEPCSCRCSARLPVGKWTARPRRRGAGGLGRLGLIAGPTRPWRSWTIADLCRGRVAKPAKRFRAGLTVLGAGRERGPLRALGASSSDQIRLAGKLKEPPTHLRSGADRRLQASWTERASRIRTVRAGGVPKRGRHRGRERVSFRAQQRAFPPVQGIGGLARPSERRDQRASGKDQGRRHGHPERPEGAEQRHRAGRQGHSGGLAQVGPGAASGQPSGGQARPGDGHHARPPEHHQARATWTDCRTSSARGWRRVQQEQAAWRGAAEAVTRRVLLDLLCPPRRAATRHAFFGRRSRPERKTYSPHGGRALEPGDVVKVESKGRPAPCADDGHTGDGRRADGSQPVSAASGAGGQAVNSLGGGTPARSYVQI